MEIYLLILSLLVLFLVFWLAYSFHVFREKVNQLSTGVDTLSKKIDVIKNTPSHDDSYLPILVHELRAPVSVIKGASDLMMKEAGTLSVDQLQTLLSQIRSSSAGLLKMIGDILDVSKMESGKFSVNKLSSNFAALLKEECSYFEPLAEIKKISLKLHIESNPLTVTFDSDRMKQVMNNLLSNALKFTPEGGEVNVEAKTQEELGKKQVFVCVCDTGVGIPDSEKGKLFHKFVQGNNQDHTREKGSGLGLVVAKGIIEAHGGKIWLEDNKPTGTRINFVIPA